MIWRGALGYGLVLLGGLVVSVVPESSWAGQSAVLAPLRETPAGRMLGLLVVVAGLGLACAAWLSLLRAARRDAVEVSLRVRVVRRATAAWALPLLVAPPMFSRDGWSYAAQGVMTHLGLSPYESGPSVLDGPIVEAVDPRWMETPTPYGPLPLIWGAGASGVFEDPWALVVAHRVLALVGVALLAWAVPRLAAWAGKDPAFASALVLPTPLMMAHGVAGLHNDVLMVGLMAAALVLTVERGWLVGAVVVGLAAAVKLPAGIVGLGVALVSMSLAAPLAERLRRLVAVAAVSGATLVGLGLVSGLGIGWVGALSVPGTVETPLSVTVQTGRLANLVLAVVVPGPESLDLVPLLRGAGTVVALGLALALALRAPTGVPAEAVRAVAIAVLWVVLLSPVVHHWYVLWCLPLLAVCHLGPRASATLLHVGWLGGIVAPLDSSLAGAGTVIAVAVGLVLAAAVVQAAVLRAMQDRDAVR